MAVLCFALNLAKSMVKASKHLHHSMLMNILRSPMSFFDTTPIGRILNRFSRDVETVDNVLPEQLQACICVYVYVSIHLPQARLN